MHMICQEHESAYWDGAKGVCCDGSVYQPDIEDTSYACCPTGKEVSIVQGKENLNHCCSEGQKAYWNGSSAQCCATATHQIVTNYISGQTDTAYACCETKEDEISSDELRSEYLTGYTMAGAVNGTCCGGYTQHDLEDIDPTLVYYWNYSYQILENGGIYYCATNWESGMKYSGSITEQYRGTYESPSKFCAYEYEELDYCKCKSSGDPKNGSNCS